MLQYFHFGKFLNIPIDSTIPNIYSRKVCYWDFDTICHSNLLLKLQNYEIRGKCFELIKNYLCSHKQITKVKGAGGGSPTKNNI